MDRRILVLLLAVLAGCGSLEAQQPTTRPTVALAKPAPPAGQAADSASSAAQFPRL